jgi:hypothetical protein
VPAVGDACHARPFRSNPAHDRLSLSDSRSLAPLRSFSRPTSSDAPPLRRSPW